MARNQAKSFKISRDFTWFPDIKIVLKIITKALQKAQVKGTTILTKHQKIQSKFGKN